MKRLEDLSPEMRRKIEQLPPEMRESALNFCPTDEVDRESRKRAEEQHEEELVEVALARERVARRALAGDFGKHVRAAAVEAERQAGSLNEAAIGRIVAAVQVSRKEGRRR